MSKVTFLCECDGDIIRATTDNCAKYGVTLTSVLEAALPVYWKTTDAKALTPVNQDVQVFLGDLRPPKGGVVLPVANDPAVPTDPLTPIVPKTVVPEAPVPAVVSTPYN